ncbi:MAG: helix-turn-helix domain-containing protein [Bacteroidaceae bacterium]
MKELKKKLEEKKKLQEIQQIASVGYIEGDIILIEELKEIPSLNLTRVKHFVLFLCTKGEFKLALNGSAITLRKNELMLCRPNVIIDNYSMSPDAEERCIVLSTKYADQLLSSVRGCWDKALYINKNPISALEEDEVELFCRYFELMRLRISKNQHIYRNEVIRSLLQAFLYDASDAMSCFLPAENKITTSSDYVFRTFIQLIERTIPKNRTVNYYSTLLNVTPKHLSSVCKETSGKTTSEWIQMYAIEEIKSFLHSSDKSIKEIAYELNFPNLSFFGRYVKKYLGVGPKDYRASKQL